MKHLYLPVFLGFLLFCKCDVFAQSGYVLIHLKDLNEKNIDSLSVWLAPEENIINAGICSSNKLLTVNLNVKDDKHIQDILALLKKHNMVEFYLKDNVPVDRLIQNCENYISF